MTPRKKSLNTAEIISIDRPGVMKKLKTIVTGLKQSDSNIRDIRVYGSFVRGDYTPDSDIDILIILDDSGVPFLKRRDAYIDFFLDLPLDIDLKVYTRDEIQKMQNEGNLFIEEALRTSAESIG